MKVISEEAIAFQPASAPKNLANELTALFQNTIDYRNKIVDSDAHRVEAVYTYFVKTIAPKLISTVAKYTGLRLSIAVPKYLMANWAIAMDFENDPVSVENIIRKYSGLLNHKNYGSYKNYKCKIFKTEAELEEFSNSLNLDTSMIQAGMMEKHHFKCKLYFDVYASFLIKETGARSCTPLTAHEITAVVLHEIGHVLSFIEHAADAVYKKDVMEQTEKLFFKNAPETEIMKYSAKQVANVYPQGSEALLKLSEYTETAEKNKGSLIWSGVRILLSAIWALISSLGIGAVRLVIHTVVNTWNATLGGDIKAMMSIRDAKDSDFAKMQMNYQCCEVLADEYVARFGYAGYLTTQLQKIFEWSRLTGLGDMKMRQFASASIFGRMLPWMIYTAFYGDKYSKDYPTEKHRYELLLVDTLKAFKDDNLSEEQLEDYYRSYNTIKKVLDNPSKTQKYTTLCNLLHDALDYIVKTPAELIFTGRFDREYERLYNQVQALANNEMYALAYQLKTMNKG